MPGRGVFSPARRAEVALLLVALCWGLSFPMIKGAVLEAPPFVFLALRFPIAFALAWPLLGWHRPASTSWLPGLGLALLLGISFYAQTLGLVYTTPARSAFITALSVILVPLFYPAITRRWPGMRAVAGALLAVVGLYFLTDPERGGLNRGDVITFICSLGYSFYVIGLEVASRKHPHRDLLVAQLGVLSMGFAPMALADPGPVHWGQGLVLGVLVTAIILAVTLFLQTRYQKDTTATRAAVIFSSEPVFAALFSYWIVGEVLAPTQGLGAALIVLAVLIAVGR